MSSDPKECLEFNSIQSAFQAPLRKQHCTTTAAAIKVVNPILHALDEKQFCLSLYRDFSKASDAVDYSVLQDCLKATGFSDHAAGWFINYLLGRTQSSSDRGLWDIRHIKKGVPQGLVMELLLFTIYINCLKISKRLPFTFMSLTQLFASFSK